jgi:hypothetical protein
MVSADSRQRLVVLIEGCILKIANFRDFAEPNQV